MNVSFPAREQNGIKSETRTIETILEQMRKTIFSNVLAALNVRNMTRENQDCSRRSSDAPKCCAYVEKLIAVTIGLNKQSLEDCGDGPRPKSG